MSETWCNQTEIKSESSSRLYVVSEKVVNGIPSGTWGCSCPGWKSQCNCKHLKVMGLRSCRTKGASITPRQGVNLTKRGRDGFSDDAYNHYDIRHGFGSAEEWVRLAEQHASGRGRYERPTSGLRDLSVDLALLNLTAMPADAKGLAKAMRKQAMKDHPDHAGGNEETFKAMINAYERLLKYYRQNY